jgi:RNA polymerase sigma factor (sigma-70 family)
MAKKKYTFNDNLEFEDLIQQGLLGLISSINKFVPDYGYSFDTYSTYWIRQGIQKSVIYKKSMIQIPANKFKRLNYINTIISELESKLKRKPTLMEVSNVTSFPIEKIYEAYTTSTKSMKIISLDRPMFSNDEKSTISDFLDNSSVNQNISADQSYNKILFPLLDKLTPSLSTLLSMRYGITPYKKHTLNELSDVFQLSIKDIAYAIKISLNYLNTFSKSKISS